MATDKRSLYRRAPTQEAVGPKDKRKTLAQGRLVVNSVSNVVTSQKDDEQTRDEAAVSSTGQEFDSMNKNTVAVKKSVSGPLRSSTTEPNREDEFAEGMDVDNSVTPRKRVPKVLSHDSSDVAQPTASLDLSETEDERNDLEDAEHNDGSEVIVVDANQKLRTLKDTEVDIALHYAHSPAKVICHTPNKVHGDVRSSGSVEHASRIGVDKIPSVLILDDEDDAPPMQQKQKTKVHKVPSVVRETAIVGNTVDPVSLRFSSSVPPNSGLSAKPVFHPNEVVAKSHAHERQENLLASYLDTESSDQVSEFSENDSHSSRDKTNSLYNKIRSHMLIANEETKRPAEKKKGPRIIPSRYLQSASSRGPLKATDKTFLGKGAGTLPGKHQTPGHRRSSSNSLNRTQRSKPSLKKHGSAAELVNSTPFPKTAQFAVSSSTPNADETSCFMTPNVDVSVISALHNRNNQQGSLPLGVSTDISTDISRLGISEVDSRVSAHNRNKKRPATEISQWDLELAYAVHLQWAFLATKARKSFQDQEKQAMEQMSSLAELNKAQDDRIAELESELERLRHANNVDEALEAQYLGLSCSTNKLPQLKEQHHRLAVALDTTRHHIPTKGIYIPDNDEQYLDGIARALQESEQLLGEISAMTRTQTKDIDQCGKALQAMENIVARERNELGRCNALLSATVSLATQENCLMVQYIQTKEEKQDIRE